MNGHAFHPPERPPVPRRSARIALAQRERWLRKTLAGKLRDAAQWLDPQPVIISSSDPDGWTLSDGRLGIPVAKVVLPGRNNPVPSAADPGRSIEWALKYIKERYGRLPDGTAASDQHDWDISRGC